MYLPALAEQVVWTSSRRDRICGNQVLTHLRKMIFPIRRPLPKVGMRVSGHQPPTKGSRMKLTPRSWSRRGGGESMQARSLWTQLWGWEMQKLTRWKVTHGMPTTHKYQAVFHQVSQVIRRPPLVSWAALGGEGWLRKDLLMETHYAKLCPLVTCMWLVTRAGRDQRELIKISLSTLRSPPTTLSEVYFSLSDATAYLSPKLNW